MVICLARLAQSVERKTLNLVVVGSSPTVGIFCLHTAIKKKFFHLYIETVLVRFQKRRNPSEVAEKISKTA